MEIGSFLQTQGYSRRNIITLLESGAIFLNESPCQYRKTPIAVGDSIMIHHPTGDKKISVQSPTTDTTIIILYNKPPGIVVSHKDDHNQTIFDHLPATMQHYYPIGRLDKDSHGLLVLTNNSHLVSHFAHPRHAHKKSYIITTAAPLSHSAILRGTAGIAYIDPDTKKQMILARDSCTPGGGNCRYNVTLSSGKKRHIRRLCELLGNDVIDLQRVGFAGWKLPPDLEQGDYRETTISAKDLQNLLAS